jgi:sugar lactone lactonase YvrE
MCDVDNNRVAVFDNVGRFDRFVGSYGYGGGELLQPEGIIAVKDERFYVCDAGNGRLVVYDEYGNYEFELYDDRMDAPYAAAMDRLGLLWVLDRTSGKLYGFNRQHRPVFEFGPLFPGTLSRLTNPFDLAFLPDGRLVLADTGNNRLLIGRVITASE